MNDQSLIVLPTYNEADNIKAIIEQVLAQPINAHVLIVDDGSPDGTADIVKSLMSLYSGRIFILERAGKLGLGTAYLAGFTWALERNYELIFEMDSDFSHEPTALPSFVEAIKNGADCVLGSRYIKGGSIPNWPFIRRFISWGGNIYARSWLFLPYKDVTSGFKCFHRKTLQSLDFKMIKSNGYTFQIELTKRLHKKGFNIREVPIRFVDRELGNSKMSKKIFLEAMWRVPLLVFCKK